jgi:hypothetical protein
MVEIKFAVTSQPRSQYRVLCRGPGRTEPYKVEVNESYRMKGGTQKILKGTCHQESRAEPKGIDGGQIFMWMTENNLTDTDRRPLSEIVFKELPCTERYAGWCE